MVRGLDNIYKREGAISQPGIIAPPSIARMKIWTEKFKGIKKVSRQNRNSLIKVLGIHSYRNLQTMQFDVQIILW